MKLPLFLILDTHTNNLTIAKGNDKMAMKRRCQDMNEKYSNEAPRFRLTYGPGHRKYQRDLKDV